MGKCGAAHEQVELFERDSCGHGPCTWQSAMPELGFTIVAIEELSSPWVCREWLPSYISYGASHFHLLSFDCGGQDSFLQ